MSDEPSETSDSYDPILALQNHRDDEPAEPTEPSAEAPLDSKARAKKILEDGAPRAATRLVHISETGDDKEAVTASRAILESVGLGKTDLLPSHPTSTLISASAMLGALIGIGKVLSIPDIEKLRNVTPLEKGTEPGEVSQKTHPPSEEPGKQPLPPAFRGGNNRPVHRGGVSEASEAPKKSPKGRRQR